VRKYKRIIALILIPSFLIFSVAYIIYPKEFNHYFRNKISHILGIRCIDYKQAVYSKKLNNIIPDYISYSSSTGIKKCRNEKEISEKATQGKLVEIKSSNGFIVAEMTHSYPYLTKDGKKLLSEIDKRFREKISGTRVKGAKFKITSMTRTTDKMKILRGVNSNASLNSPHQYGNAFDISYIRFSTRAWFLTNCDEKYLMEALAEVIWQLKQERKCWATFEKNQNCYHVVAR
jgi:hypothetical protein